MNVWNALHLDTPSEQSSNSLSTGQYLIYGPYHLQYGTVYLNPCNMYRSDRMKSTYFKIKILFMGLMLLFIINI